MYVPIFPSSGAWALHPRNQPFNCSYDVGNVYRRVAAHPHTNHAHHVNDLAFLSISSTDLINLTLPQAPQRKMRRTMKIPLGSRTPTPKFSRRAGCSNPKATSTSGRQRPDHSWVTHAHIPEQRTVPNHPRWSCRLCHCANTHGLRAITWRHVIIMYGTFRAPRTTTKAVAKSGVQH